MQPNVHIDIEGLRRTGIRIATPLVTVEGAINQQVTHLTVSGPAAGWESAPALADASNAWRNHLNELSQRVTRFGADLVASADEFEAADRAAASSFNIPAPPPAPSYNVPIPVSGK
ncbi:hypothetical protein KZ829_06510 [Actinoplanes hulinensis]|uniref:PE domain-containing protein n=1 Tax=Actinoplanes hulinensis TaxID=1144547 RepID=A0ABS7AXD7_9ACTN|nr:type VII secretion target [Actinoplanes hulinensis]MBW6433395.1 hypothetical protein [Actinoplanes hulinensis]